MFRFNPNTGDFTLNSDPSEGIAFHEGLFMPRATGAIRAPDNDNEVEVIPLGHPDYLTTTNQVSASELFETSNQVSTLSDLFLDYIAKALHYNDPSKPSAPFDANIEVTQIIHNGRDKLLVHSMVVKMIANNYLKYANTGMIVLDAASRGKLEQIISSLHVK